MARAVLPGFWANGAVLRRMVWFFMALVMFCRSLVESQCKFPNHKSPPDLSVIKPLLGERFVVQDEKGEYSYDVGVCTSAINPPRNYTDVGALQTQIATKKQHVIGKFMAADIKIGTDWAMLEYKQGDKYHSHCMGAERVAIIMITCDPKVQAISDAKPVVVGEENGKNNGCYYLFEMRHSCICTDVKKPLMSFSLSVGSIVVIVFMSLCGVYLLGGVLYNRFVLGAKGMEQIPNYSFWLDFGNLQADGCNLVCRTRTASRSYKGIGDDQLAEAEDDRDDHLLPM